MNRGLVNWAAIIIIVAALVMTPAAVALIYYYFTTGDLVELTWLAKLTASWALVVILGLVLASLITP